MDVSWPPFWLERVGFFSVQGCILQQLVTGAKHLQRFPRLFLVRPRSSGLAQTMQHGFDRAAKNKGFLSFW
ncbi:MAG: hypothetical protein U1D25_17210 [Hydrogenophaga sp.]|uniref:hypothetical protein n=1 Tax=Hydrogenophaga sp. TaxID=1904254 RepID=UPI0027629EDC|nr:hypothetical protein [Hydrogenophaga sp.]MDP2417109.1 hypothetical protein [Hydrogenophaga sp.]MDZ4189824.1 hypothetical protein [Hydrogenophaga sp.]